MSITYDLDNLLQSQPQELHRDRVSRVYNGEVSDAETQRRTRDRIDWMIDRCPIGDILDIGCSEGIFAVKAAHQSRKILGIDIHPEAVDYAQRYAAESLEESLRSRVDFRVCDVFSMREIEPVYDAVILGEVIEHVYEPANMMARAALALRAGGVMIVTTPWGFFPAPDHHQTFFLSDFISKLPGVLEWNELSVVDGYIRFVGRKTAATELDVARLYGQNRTQFSPEVLLGLSEQAAMEAQRFLRQVIDARYAKWVAANEVAVRRKDQLDELNARIKGKADEIDQLKFRFKGQADEIEQKLRFAHKEDVGLLSKKIATLEEKVSLLRLESRSLEQERNKLKRQQGSLRLALRHKLYPYLVIAARRARGQVEKRPAIKAALMRALPTAIIYRLHKYATLSNVPAVKPEAGGAQILKAIKIPEALDLIVFCQAYPDGGGKYGGEFIRTRVEGYKKRGHKVLVVAISNKVVRPRLLDLDGTYLLQAPHSLMMQCMDAVERHSCGNWIVHSPSPEMVERLCAVAASKRIVTVFHGYEVRDYRRLSFNYTTEELEIQRQLLDSINDARFNALRRIDRTPAIRPIFVSEFLRKIARYDSGSPLHNSAVVPNFIDGEFFSFHEKTPDMAKKILLIRSFQARNYANDIALNALKALSTQPEFADLRITIRGTGRYFQELTMPLRDFENVDIAEAYLSPAEMKELHDQHGLFLVPSRFDTQGVTMGEAMSSGLVCVTNPVAGIPEFFDESCGYLAKPECVRSFADAISRAISDGEIFSKKSRAAGARVRKQCGFAQTIERELETALS